MGTSAHRRLLSHMEACVTLGTIALAPPRMAMVGPVPTLVASARRVITALLALPTHSTAREALIQEPQATRSCRSVLRVLGAATAALWVWQRRLGCVTRGRIAS